MLSIGSCYQFGKAPSAVFMRFSKLDRYGTYLDIVINQIFWSVSLRPKVITLSGLHRRNFFFQQFTKKKKQFSWMREINWKYFHVDGKYQLPMSDSDTKLIIVHKNFPPQKDDQNGMKKTSQRNILNILFQKLILKLNLINS